MKPAQHHSRLSLAAGRIALAAGVALLLGSGVFAEDEADSEAAVVEATVGYFPLEVDPAEHLDSIALPEGFHISIYRDGLEAARSMAMSESGTLFLGTHSNRSRDKIGKVYACLLYTSDAADDTSEV